MLFRIVAIAAIALAFSLAPTAAEEPHGFDLAVGECSPWIDGYRFCRGGEAWFVIEVLDEQLPPASPPCHLLGKGTSSITFDDHGNVTHHAVECWHILFLAALAAD